MQCPREALTATQESQNDSRELFHLSPFFFQLFFWPSSPGPAQCFALMQFQFLRLCCSFKAAPQPWSQPSRGAVPLNAAGCPAPTSQRPFLAAWLGAAARGGSGSRSRGAKVEGASRRKAASPLCLCSSSRILGGPVPRQLFLQPVLACARPHAPRCH